MKAIKHISLLIIFLLGTTLFAQDGNDTTKLRRNVYKVGEFLKYRVHYGFLDAGIATLEVKSETLIHNRPTFYILGLGKSVGTFSWFFTIKDKYETFIDKEYLAPLLFLRDVNEGGYLIKQHVTFDHIKKTAVSEGKTYNIPKNAQDMLSSFYYARCMDYSNLQVGNEYTIQTFLDDEVYPLRIRYLGKENVKTNAGTIKTLKFRPLLQQGRIIKEKEELTLYISDDDNHIPVRLKAEVMFGSIKMDLMEYRNLSFPLAKL